MKTAKLLIKLLLKLFIITVVLFVFAQNALSHENHITVYLNDDGTAKENIEWIIKVAEPNHYYPVTDWWIQIPFSSMNISVYDNYGQINFEIKNAPEDGKYKKLEFSNRREIHYGSYYFFNITYVIDKNPVIYEPYGFYDRWIKKSVYDDSFSFTVVLPYGAILDDSDPEPDKIDLENRLMKLYFNPMGYEPVLVKVDFNLPGAKPEIGNISSSFYALKAPERYLGFYKEVITEADKSISEIERLYGFSAPYALWHVEVLNVDSEAFKNRTNTQGMYVGKGSIKLKITHLQDSYKEDAVYTIIHETIHGFNDAYFKGIPDFWWDEGTAQYAGYKVLSVIEYNASKFTDSDDMLLSKCKNINLSFIAHWDPTQHRNASEINKTKFFCMNESVDEDELGYAYSEYIIRSLSENYSGDGGMLLKFYRNVKDKNIVFSPDRDLLNNQINYLLSDSLGSDLTGKLNQLQIKTDSWKDSMDSIIKANSTINRLEKHSKTIFFASPRKKLDEALRSFMGGDFKKSANTADNAEKEALETEEKRSSAINEISEADASISKLESESEKRHYKSQRSILDDAFNEYENKNFDYSKTLAENALKEALETKQKISDAADAIINAEDTIQKEKSIFSYPFLMLAEDEIKNSKDYFNEGNFDKSMEYSKNSEQTARNAKQNSIISLAATIFILTALIAVKRKLRKKQ